MKLVLILALFFSSMTSFAKVLEVVNNSHSPIVFTANFALDELPASIKEYVYPRLNYRVYIPSKVSVKLTDDRERDLCDGQVFESSENIRLTYELNGICSLTTW